MRKIVICFVFATIGVISVALTAHLFDDKGAGDEKPEHREIRRVIGETDNWLGERTGRRTSPGLVRIREMVADLPDAEQRLEAARFFAGQMLAIDLPGDDGERAFVRVDNFWQTWMEALRCLRECQASEQEQMSFIVDVLTKYKDACRHFDKPRAVETQAQKADRECLAKGLRRHFKDGVDFIRINDLRILSYGLSEPNKAALREWFDEWSGCVDNL